MIKRLLNLRGLFSNTKFLVVFSVVLAFIFWIVVALEFTPIIETKIENVPVVINLEGTMAEDTYKLERFGENEFTIDITIQGKRYEVGNNKIKPEDFIVEAETAYVDSAGEKALAIKVEPKNKDAEFEIISLSAEYINVYFDQKVTVEIPVNFVIKNEEEGNIAADGYIFDRSMISFSQKLKLTGPKTQIDKINNVSLYLNPGEELKESTKVNGKLSFNTSAGRALDDEDLKYIEVSGVKYKDLNLEIEVPIYKELYVRPTVTITDLPNGYGNMLSYTISPQRVRIGVLPELASKYSDEIMIGEIPFSKITATNRDFTVYPTDLKGVIFLDANNGFDVHVVIKEVTTESMNIIWPIQ